VTRVWVQSRVPEGRFLGIERVLVVDDDRSGADPLCGLLEREGCSVVRACDGRQAWERFLDWPADLVLLDDRMRRLGGLGALRRIRSVSPGTPVVLTSACATAAEAAAEAVRLGAYDYLLKPVRPEQVRLLLHRLRERDRLYAHNEYLRAQEESAHGRLVTGDRNMLRICQAIRRAAASRASILIQGESGTGKEIVARYIHRMSPRRDGAFIRVNCASLPEALLEAEMFARFKLAHGGTLLLEEVGAIPPRLQARLLRVLEEQSERPGALRTPSLDVRVISTTSRNLKPALEAGSFRRDLYYRLSVVPVCLPPLRQRRADISLLVEHFLDHYSALSGRPRPRITNEALRLMRRYEWPGNVRELSNLIQRLVILKPGESIGPDDLPLEMRRSAAGAHPGISVGHTIQEAERWLILETLRHTSGNRTAAAGLLGVTTRTLRNKLARYRREAERDPEKGPRPEPFSPPARPKRRRRAKLPGGIPFATAPLRG